MITVTEMEKGQAYIRVISISNDRNSAVDWAFSSDVMIFDGVSEQGVLHMHYETEPSRKVSRNLNKCKNNITKGWMPASCIWDGPKTELSCLEGKLIKQINPILLQSGTIFIYKGEFRGLKFRRLGFAVPRGKDVYDRRFMNRSVKLLSATESHLVIDIDGCQKILDRRYTKARDWQLAE